MPVVRILGTVSVAGRTYRSSSVRMVVCWLALHRDRPMPINTTARVLWPLLPAATAGRRVREAARQLSDEHPRQISMQDGTVRLTVPADESDHEVFRALVGGPDSPRTRSQLDAGLASWHGEPCSDLADVPDARPAIAALVDLHHWTVEEVLADRLRGEVDYRAVAELSAAVHRQPGRERLWRQLAVALFLVSRQLEALDRITEGRAELAAAGVEPSSSLTGLATAILAGDAVGVRRFL